MPTQSLRIVMTGATRGLGRALLHQFAILGHRVAGCGRNALQIDDLRRAYLSPHDFAAVDVTNDIQVSDWAARVLQHHGVPDLLINNAALMNHPAPLWEVPAAEFDALMAVNVTGVTNVIRHFVPAMVGVGRGTIINLSSGWGRSTSPGVAPYCASKWAIEGLTKALADDLPAGMAAIPLNPGIIDTDMLRQAWGSKAQAYENATAWAERAAPQLLALGPRENGKSVSVR